MITSSHSHIPVNKATVKKSELSNCPHVIERLYHDIMVEGFMYECGCGELYRSPDSAKECRKCFKYLSLEDYFAREVTEITVVDEGVQS